MLKLNNKSIKDDLTISALKQVIRHFDAIQGDDHQQLFKQIDKQILKYFDDNTSKVQLQQKINQIIEKIYTSLPMSRNPTERTF